MALLAFTVAVAASPSLALAVGGAKENVSQLAPLSLTALPIIPLAYFVIVSRWQLGGLETRANRAFSIYLYLSLVGAFLLFLIALSALGSVSQGVLISLGALTALLIALFSILGFPAFQRWVDQRLLGIKLPYQNLLEDYSSRIAASASTARLLQLLAADVFPSLLARALIMPSLRWPFAEREILLRAVAVYGGGTLILPALIGLLAETRNNPFWRETQLSRSPILRLYTYQGAFIGFHLGYFAAFLVVLIQNFLRLPSTAWVEWLLALTPLIMGHIGARVVPYNLRRAFGRLDLRDGALFFVFVLLGPAWGFFLAEFSPFLTFPSGLFFVLFAVTLLAGGMAWQARKKRSARGEGIEKGQNG